MNRKIDRSGIQVWYLYLYKPKQHEFFKSEKRHLFITYREIDVSQLKKSYLVLHLERTRPQNALTVALEKMKL